jgi:hypothetical protein
MRTCRRAALSESRRSARGGHVTACCHATRGETPFPLGRWDWEGSFDLLCACRIVLARSATVALGFAHREDRSIEFRFRPHRPRSPGLWLAAAMKYSQRRQQHQGAMHATATRKGSEDRARSEMFLSTRRKRVGWLIRFQGI